MSSWTFNTHLCPNLKKLHFTLCSLRPFGRNVLFDIWSSVIQLGWKVTNVSAQRPVEHFKRTLQNITTDWMLHSVLCNAGRYWWRNEDAAIPILIAAWMTFRKSDLCLHFSSQQIARNSSHLTAHCFLSIKIWNCTKIGLSLFPRLCDSPLGKRLLYRAEKRLLTVVARYFCLAVA